MQIGNYEIQSELGRGGMGVVYRAFEPALNRVVAIKMLNDGIAHQPALVARFHREAQAMAALSDPNVVQIYAVGTHQGQPYFVMEYIEGESLSARLKRERMSVSEARKLIRQAASGLQAAHERGLVHRDIKPGNLMITPKNVLKVTDFGIALSEGSGERLTGTGGVVGTPGYLSPEACLGEPLDARTDVFALGVVFFEMLTGRLPFDDKSPYGLMIAVVQAQIPDVTQLNRDVDAGTLAILTRMLERKPEARFQSCAELVQALDAPVGLPPVRTPPPISPPSPIPNLSVPAIGQPMTPQPQPQPAGPGSPASYPPQPPVAPPLAPPIAHAPVQPPQQSHPQPLSYPPQPPTPYGQPPPGGYPPIGQPTVGRPVVAPVPPPGRSMLAPAVAVGVVLLGLGGYGISRLDLDTVTPVDPIAPSPSITEPDAPAGSGSDLYRELQLDPTVMYGSCKQEFSSSNLDDAGRSQAAQELLGTYTGTIADKPFELVFRSHQDTILEGFNVAAGTQRPVCAVVLGTEQEIDDDGETWTIYRTAIREPGDEKNDGRFELKIRHSEEHIGGGGDWIGYTTNESLEVAIENFSSKTDGSAQE